MSTNSQFLRLGRFESELLPLQDWACVLAQHDIAAADSLQLMTHLLATPRWFMCCRSGTLNVLLKNLADASIAGITFWLFGWAFAYGNENDGPFIGGADFALALTTTGYGDVSWVFQWAFAAASATIVRAGFLLARLRLMLPMNGQEPPKPDGQNVVFSYATLPPLPKHAPLEPYDTIWAGA